VSDAHRLRWDARYAADAHAGPAAPAPPDALRGHLEVVPRRGRALDVACGRGGVAVWLARRGLDVDAVDVSPVALAEGAALAAAVGAADRVRWIAHDLDGGLPVACAGPYEVVVCQRFRDPSRYPELAAVLAPGAVLAVTVLSEVGAEQGPFRAAPGELRGAFRDLEVLAAREGGGEAVLVARAPLRTPTPTPPRGSRPAPPPPS
jgi:SAM-dependent methyltransferase